MITVLVTGGRDYMDKAYVAWRLNQLDHAEGIGQLVEGGASGADTWARLWALGHPDVILATVNADWNGPCRETCAPNHRRTHSGLTTTYCPAAGVYRNQAMLEVWHPDVVLAFPGNDGTKGMVDLAVAAVAAGVTVIQTVRST